MAKREIPIGRLAVAMALFLLVGAPIVLYVWWTLDQVLAGTFQFVPIAAGSALACIFVVAAAILGRYIRSLVPPD